MAHELALVRFKLLDNSTLGLLYLPDAAGPSVFCFTLEDKVREIKIAGQTAIPAGRYQIVWNFSEHFQKEMPELLNVPNFAGVRIHAGNTDADTEGCVLVGFTATIIAGSISQSTAAVLSLYDKLQGMLKTDQVFVTITNP